MITMTDAGYGMRSMALNDMVMDCIMWNDGNIHRQHQGMFDALVQDALTDEYKTLYVYGRNSGWVDVTTDPLQWVEDKAVTIAFICRYEDGKYWCRLLMQE